MSAARGAAPSSALARGVGSWLPPSTRRLVWRSFYGALAWLTSRNDLEFSCMNWGYDDDGETLIDFPTDLGPERYSLQLYLALTQGVPLTDRSIAEISCGRGGGLTELHTRSRPMTSVGVDLTPGNIALCERRFGARPDLRFQVGDAMSLPFREDTLDALLSVEASHCYPDEQRFIAEAARVVRPGGWLLWTDFRCVDELPALRAALTEHFELVVYRDITANVLSAMDADAGRRRALIAATRAPALRRLLTYFAAASGETESVASFRRGEREYFLMQLRRR